MALHRLTACIVQFGVFYWRVFIKGFCQHVVLCIVTALIIGITFTEFGEGVGLHELTYYENWKIQLINGLFLALVAYKVFLLGFIFHHDQHHDQETLHSYGLKLTLSITATILVPYLLICLFAWRPHSIVALYHSMSEFITSPWLCIGVVATILCMTCVISYTYHLAHSDRLKDVIAVIQSFADQFSFLFRSSRRMSSGDAMLFLTVVIEFFLCLVFMALAELFDLWSPVSLLAAFVYLVLSVYYFFKYTKKELTAVIAMVAVLLLCIGAIPSYKYYLPSLEDFYETSAMSLQERLAGSYESYQGLLDEKEKQELAGMDANAKAQFILKRVNDKAEGSFFKDKGAPLSLPNQKILSLADVEFNSYRLPEHLKRIDIVEGKRVEKRPVVVIVVSGGGLRAAAWAYAVLAKLEMEFAKLDNPTGQQVVHHFPSHTRLITGASGGMLGASAYATTLDKPRTIMDAWQPTSGETASQRQKRLYQTYQNLTKDALTPVAKRMLFKDFWWLFLPMRNDYDRGQRLEQVWHENFQGALSVPFTSLLEKEREGWMPSLVFTPMIVEDGRRLIISNLDMQLTAHNGGCAGEKFASTYSHEAFEYFRIFPDRPSNPLLLSTAIRLSASFPFLSPAVSLPVTPRRRVVDAGYYDNYGVSLGASWLFSKAYRSIVEKYASGILFIQIRDGLSEDDRKLTGDLKSSKERSIFSRSLEDGSSPLEAFMNARVASASFRNDGMLELLSRYYRDTFSDASMFFTTATFELSVDVSLSWYLSPSQIDQIWRSAGCPSEAPAPEDEASRRAAEVDKQIKVITKWWKDRKGGSTTIKRAEK